MHIFSILYGVYVYADGPMRTPVLSSTYGFTSWTNIANLLTLPGTLYSFFGELILASHIMFLDYMFLYNMGVKYSPTSARTGY